MYEKFDDYTGKKIKDCTIIQKLPPMPGKKGARYLCKCSCGNFCVKHVSAVGKAYRYGDALNCGCKKKPRLRNILIGSARRRKS